jgi:hypothetical protein
MESKLFDQLLLAKKIVESKYILIFMNGDIIHVSDEYSDFLTDAMENKNPNIFFDNWDLTAFINLEKQEILNPDTGNCLESLYLYTPNESAYPHLCKKYDIVQSQSITIIIVLDRYKIDKKNLKSILEIEYLDKLLFFDIIKEYTKFSPTIKELFIDLHGIRCKKCKNATNIDFTIFSNIHFTKCARCRFVLKTFI